MFLRWSRHCVLLTILIPFLASSQVIIKEKITIQPRMPAPSQKAAQLYDLFNPPLFVDNYGTPALALGSTLTISGTVAIDGDFAAGQQAQVVFVADQYHEYSLAWKGRDPVGSGGNPFEGQSPFTGTFGKEAFPNVQLYVFDWQWGTGAREVSNQGNRLDYSFTSYLRQGLNNVTVPVTGTATATGAFLPNEVFSSWSLSASPEQLRCASVSNILAIPLNGDGFGYQPAGIQNFSGTVTMSVSAGGDYVYLRSGVQQGKEITVPMTLLPNSQPAFSCDLVFDPQLGPMAGESDVATVSVTGDGKTGSIFVTLLCEKLDHLRIRATPQTLLIGGTSTLRVTAEDINNQEVVPESDFDVTFTLSSPDIYWGSVRDTTKPDGLLPGAPGILLKRSAGAREGANRTLSRLQSSMFGSFAVDGGAAEPDQITVPYSVAKEGKVKYVADGDMLSWFDSITVSIRVEKTADPNKFGSTDVMVKNVTCARVTFVPPKLAPGETAQLSFKKVLDDGTLEDFPADQVLDVMIVGGGGNAGTLQSASGGGTVLTGTLAPVTYIAPATIDGDSLVVQVSAFAYGSGGATLSVAQAKAMPLLKKVPGQVTTKAMSNKAKGSVMVALGKLLAESVCEPGQAVVKKKGCEDAPPCPPEQFNPPDFVVKPQPNGFAGITICQQADALGAFQPLTGANSFKPFSADPCFDRERGIWRFSVVGPIEINAVLDLCYANIANRAQQLITSINQITLADSCQALQDFRDHYSYPVKVSRPNGYLIQEALLAHENQHKADYLIRALLVRKEFDKEVENYRPRCEEFANVSEAQTTGTTVLNGFMRGFLNVASREWSKLVGTSRNDPRRRPYEEKTHTSPLVKFFVKAYIEELQQKYQCQ